MTTPFNPDSWLDLLAYVIIGIPATIAAVATIRGQHKGKERWKRDREDVVEIRDNAREIHEQTVNDHAAKSNMRDDIDEIRELVKDMSDRQIAYGRDIRGIRADVGELRGADRDARTEHDDLVRRLNAFIRREHPGADPL